LRLFVALLIVAAAGAQAQERSLRLQTGETVTYRLITDDADSARAASAHLLRLLAAGEIDAAAHLSNAPERRREVLRDYLKSVGEAEFRRVFGEYARRRVIAEVAIGERRLLVWDLGDRGQHLAGQYFIRSPGGFLLDDVPNEERLHLTRVLRAYRSGQIKRADGTD
jgi:hypothetical protein